MGRVDATSASQQVWRCTRPTTVSDTSIGTNRVRHCHPGGRIMWVNLLTGRTLATPDRALRRWAPGACHRHVITLFWLPNNPPVVGEQPCGEEARRIAGVGCPAAAALWPPPSTPSALSPVYGGSTGSGGTAPDGRGQAHHAQTAASCGERSAEPPLPATPGACWPPRYTPSALSPASGGSTGAGTIPSIQGQDPTCPPRG